MACIKFDIALLLATNFVFILHSTIDGAGCLHAAVKNKLPAVVDLLCQKGAVVDKCDAKGDCTLWQALSAEQFDMADILVSMPSTGL